MNREQFVRQYKTNRRRLAARLEIIEKRIGPLTGKRVLDLGCGHGETAILAAFRGAIAIGLDARGTFLTDRSLGALKDMGKMNGIFKNTPSFALGLAEKTPFKKNSFDLVILNDTLDHVKDDAAAIREAHSLLRENGVLFIAVPNRRQLIEHHAGEITQIPFFGFFPKAIQDRLLARGAEKGSWLHRLYDAGDVRKLTHGLFREEFMGYEMLFFEYQLKGHGSIGGFLRAVSRFIGKTPLRVFGSGILFLGRKSAYP